MRNTFSSRQDANEHARQDWLKQEQQPAIKPHAPQSNFEESPHWRICLLIAVIVIGIQVFSPDPGAAPLRSQHIHATT
ncbi:hypothetical protein [Paraburkholderia tropica]|uniref:hypothetical protein n=1 Tax=Paraburkholderia tropica TaxID=92647 RepID=UPI0031DFABE6